MEADFTHGLLNALYHMGIINGSVGTTVTQIITLEKLPWVCILLLSQNWKYNFRHFKTKSRGVVQGTGYKVQLQTLKCTKFSSQTLVWPQGGSVSSPCHTSSAYWAGRTCSYWRSSRLYTRNTGREDSGLTPRHSHNSKSNFCEWAREENTSEPSPAR